MVSWDPVWDGVNILLQNIQVLRIVNNTIEQQWRSQSSAITGAVGGRGHVYYYKVNFDPGLAAEVDG